MDNIYDKLFTGTYQFNINLGDVLKLPMIVILIGNVLYSFMLVLKIKILADTIESDSNKKIKSLVYINMLVSIVVGILATFIIILG